MDATASQTSVSAKKSFEYKGAVLVKPNDLANLKALLQGIEDAGATLAEQDQKRSLDAKASEMSEERFASSLEKARAMVRESAKFVWHAELRDHTTLGPMSLEDILALTNTWGRRINSISIENSYSAKLRLAMKIRREPMLAVFTYDLSGSSDLVEHYARKLDEFCDSIKPAWAFMYDRRFRWVATLLVTLAIGLVLTRYVPNPEQFAWAIPTVVIVLYFLLFALLNFVLVYVFPRCAFSIGKEEELLAIQDKSRWAILIGTLISLATGWLLSYIGE